jgi:hypothetical protein
MGNNAHIISISTYYIAALHIVLPHLYIGALALHVDIEIYTQHQVQVHIPSCSWYHSTPGAYIDIDVSSSTRHFDLNWRALVVNVQNQNHAVAVRTPNLNHMSELRGRSVPWASASAVGVCLL